MRFRKVHCECGLEGLGILERTPRGMELSRRRPRSTLFLSQIQWTVA